MGNRALGSNCGNTTWTNDCCGFVGQQEICGFLEVCWTRDEITYKMYSCDGEGWRIAGFISCIVVAILLCIGSRVLYENREWVFTKIQKKREPIARESEVRKLLDDSFKL